MTLTTRLLLLSFLALSACMQPTTQAPVVDAGAAAAERSRQAELSRSANASGTAYEATAARLQRVAGPIVKASEAICPALQGRSGQCQFAITMAEGDANSLNAFADGTRVVVEPGMMRFADDTELAFVLSHEMAHNLMGHVTALKTNVATGAIAGTLADRFLESQGYATGGKLAELGTQYGRYRFSPEFEYEADYVGLYIMARSGYDYTKGPEFWRRMTAASPDAAGGGPTHPGNAERYVAMQSAINEIKAKQAAGQPLVPTFREKKSRFGF